MSGSVVVSVSLLGISPDHQDLCHEGHGWDGAQAGAWWPRSTLRCGLSTLRRVSRTPQTLPSKVRVEREQHWEPFPWHVPGQGGCCPVPMELLIGEGWKIQMPGSDVSSETTSTANYCPPRLLWGSRGGGGAAPVVAWVTQGPRLPLLKTLQKCWAPPASHEAVTDIPSPDPWEVVWEQCGMPMVVLR